MKNEKYFSRLFQRRPVLVLLSVLLVVIVIGGVIVVNDITAGRQAKTPSQPTAVPTQHSSASSTQVVQGPVSPLLFGTNLGLFTADDQVVTSATTRDLMQQIHVRIVRIPMRTNLPNALEVQAEQAVKSIGAIPLVVLTGLRNPHALADDTRMIQNSNSVFGDSLVYYEFGNEDDWNGITIERYTQGWNTLIPQFKRLARNGKFIGPVSYQYSHDNLTTFLQGANPRPDAISWHEYTCSYKDPAASCLANLDNWTTHLTDARAVMQSTLGTALPIMITEWNYAADQSTQSDGLPHDDGKYNNTSFMTAWTTKALHVLAANQVFASMQYSVTNTALPLITFNNTLTTQGMAFQAIYHAMVS
ncbi:MAG TPA: hypothetical protein VFQ36_21345 [Ktedonobacteraceae bacterium]|nr:hypothetical protein [Ktedonobacteraceae bacterium]